MIDAIPVFQYDEEELLEACIQAVARGPEMGDPSIILPTRERRDTKKNRVRFDPDDPRSPSGLILRDSYSEFIVESAGQEAVRMAAPGQFSCLELAHWLMLRQNPEQGE